MRIKNILFDLDGTLTDSKTGIVKSIQYALQYLDQPAPIADELLWCLGPPLISSFIRLLGPENSGLAEKALTLYRERYNKTGKFENQLYENIHETLHILQDKGFTLFVATSKPYFFTIQITNHFELTPYFHKIYGSELNGDRCDKTELIHHIIQNESLKRQQTVMVGDREHDIYGAKKNHIKSIGVAYGYGSEDELRKAGADSIVNAPAELLTGLKALQRAAGNLPP